MSGRRVAGKVENQCRVRAQNFRRLEILTFADLRIFGILVGAFREYCEVYPRAGSLELEKGAAATQLDVVRMGPKCENLSRPRQERSHLSRKAVRFRIKSLMSFSGVITSEVLCD